MSLGEDRNQFSKIGQSGGARVFDLGAKDDAVHFKPNLAANLASNDIIVAGEDLDRHARLIERPDRASRAVFRRVEERDIAKQRQINFVVN